MTKTYHNHRKGLEIAKENKNNTRKENNSRINWVKYMCTDLDCF